MAVQPRRGIVLRLSTEGSEQVKAALKSLGAEGEAALRQLERGAQHVTPRLTVLDSAAKRVARSINGEFQRLATGIVSMISPVNLLIAGFGMLVGAAIGWISQLTAGGRSLEEITETIGQTTERLRDVYGEAAAASDDFADVERFRLLLQAQEDLREATEKYNVAWNEVVRRHGNMSGDMLTLFEAVAFGTETFAEMEAFLVRYATTIDDEATLRLIEQIRAMIAPMTAAEQAVMMLDAQIAVLNGTATEAQRVLLGLAGAVEQYAGAVAALGALGLPAPTDWDRAAAAWRTALDAAQTQEERNVANAAYLAAVGRLQAEQAQREADTAARARETAGRAAAGEQRRLEQLALSILQDVNPALAAEIELLSRLSDLAAIRAAELLTEADYALAVAAAHRDYTAALEEARLAQEGMAGGLRAGAMRALRELADEALDAGGVIERALTGAFRAAESAFDDFLEGGEDSFKKFVEAILKDLARLAFQQGLAMLAKGILGGFTAGAGGGLGGGGFLGGIFAAPVVHGGGVMGDPMPTRQVSPAVFLGAPRFHNGLAPDEIPAILQRGERVIPKGGERLPAINVIMQGLPPAKVERRARSDGGLDLILRAVAEDIAGGGVVAGAIGRASRDRVL